MSLQDQYLQFTERHFKWNNDHKILEKDNQAFSDESAPVLKEINDAVQEFGKIIGMPTDYSVGMNIERQEFLHFMEDSTKFLNASKAYHEKFGKWAVLGSEFFQKVTDVHNKYGEDISSVVTNTLLLEETYVPEIDVITEELKHELKEQKLRYADIKKRFERFKARMS